MPYSLTLQAYTPAEFYAVAPESWERRLREVSPIEPQTDHLRFRYFEPHDNWLHPDRGQWALYSCRPIRLMSRDRALQFAQHWSELPSEFQRGRKALVSNYQHFMWHSQGLYVTPFLILQGEWGGTPAQYTPREKAFLMASNCWDEPFDLGSFPPCPFDERVVSQIGMRDRLLQASNDYGTLGRLDTPESLEAEDEAAERFKRETYIKTWMEMIRPQAEFLQSFLAKKESVQALPDAPEGLSNAVGRWKEEYVETGSVPTAEQASSRTLQVAVH